VLKVVVWKFELLALVIGRKSELMLFFQGTKVFSRDL
jgi:hypothetical protein